MKLSVHHHNHCDYYCAETESNSHNSKYEFLFNINLT